MHEGHRKRMRGKFLQSGKDAFHEHEMLEMLLYYSNARGDTNPLAHTLIDKFGSFSGVLDASFEDLMQVKGVGENTAFLLKLIPAAAAVYMDDKFSDGKLILSSDDAFAFLRSKYIDVNVEISSALFLNRKGKLIKWAKIGEGSVISTAIDTRKLVEIALQCKATQIILCHNHPSGIAIPSRDDIFTTQNIVDALRSVNVKVVDHIIIAGNDYVSMAQSRESSIIFM